MSNFRRMLMNVINKEKVYLPSTESINYRIYWNSTYSAYIMSQKSGDHYYHTNVQAYKTYGSDFEGTIKLGFSTPAGYQKSKVVTPITFPFTPTSDGWICTLAAKSDTEYDMKIYEM